MLRALILGTLVIGVASCVTEAGGLHGVERREMTGLEDMSFAYIKSTWGEPESNLAQGDGRVLLYKNVRSEDEDPINLTLTIKHCDVRIDLNRELLVKSWGYENCHSVSSGK